MELSLKSLEKAVSIRRKIEQLEKQLASIFEPYPSRGARRLGKRRMSAAGRAKIAVAQRSRWAKKKAGGTVAVSKSPRKQRGLTPAGRKRLSQLMKARWAARKRANAKK
jgi:hypothetical protein